MLNIHTNIIPQNRKKNKGQLTSTRWQFLERRGAGLGPTGIAVYDVLDAYADGAGETATKQIDKEV